ncbi:MAG: polysaccharide deacetylase family protein [Bacteroidota bacterium]
MKEILLYCHNRSPRLEYVIDFIFREVLDTSVRISNSRSVLKDHELVINYSPEEIKSVFRIVPSGLLDEQGIKDRDISVIRDDDMVYLFPVKAKDFDFDLFSAVFFMLSRYEEYLPFEKDRYGRYKVTNSIAWKEKFLDKPVVNIWIYKLTKQLSEYYPGLSFPEPQCAFIPTIDIDNPWAFLNKSFYRKIGGISKDIISINYNKLAYRLSILRMIRRDPYDSFDFIKEKHKEDLKIFYLLGTRSRHDSKISLRNPAWNKIVKELSEIFEPGLHPSFHSNKKPKFINEEKRNLESLTGREIKISRQHFLRLSFPSTYRNLINAGITGDYSMGYAEISGFRAGTSYAFSFYDILNETKTELKIHPFILMDRTLKDYMNLNTEEAKDLISGLIETIKKFGGNFVSVWHNESLGTAVEWEGWDEVYDFLLEKAQELNFMK